MENGLKREIIEESCASKKRYMESLGSIDESPRMLKGIKLSKEKLLKVKVPQTLFKGFFGKENMQTRSFFAIKNKKCLSMTSAKKSFQARLDSEKEQFSCSQSEEDREKGFRVSDIYCKTMKKIDKEVIFIEKDRNIGKILEIYSDYSSECSKDDLAQKALFESPAKTEFPNP